MFKVQGACQNYAWGRVGRNSWVSQFVGGQVEEKNYAEFWIGTHKSLPSRLAGGTLADFVGELPYLFKVLSIAKPLSIQVHPSKSQAEALHQKSPELYPDNNYKPEMCIAQGKLCLFFGLRPAEEISSVLRDTPELLSIVGQGDLRSQLHKLYENEAATQAAVKAYCERVTSGVYHGLSSHFPQDSGIFFSMFMNYIELSDGEAIVIGPGVPHCYIEGECIEAMACSDNVVRAGLTPKDKDVSTLLEIMDYSTSRPNFVQKIESDGKVIYPSGYQEFQVAQIKGSGLWQLDFNRPALGFVCQGMIRAGDVAVGNGECFLVRDNVNVSSEDGEVFICY